MTNYPRDEFDRVPEFSTRVGSHHANGWAQSAKAGDKGGKFRWVAIAAVLVLLVGAGSFFFFGPNSAPLLTNPDSSQSSTPSPTSSEEPSQTASASPSNTIDDADVVFDQLIGIYNAAGMAGVASTGQEALLAEDFTNTYTDNWVRDEQVSAVYYMTRADRTTAQKVAEVLNIESVLQTQNIPNSVTVVLGADNPVETE